MKYFKDFDSNDLISKKQMDKIKWKWIKINGNLSKLELKYSLHIYPNDLYSNILIPWLKHMNEEIIVHNSTLASTFPIEKGGEEVVNSLCRQQKVTEL